MTLISWSPSHFQAKLAILELQTNFENVFIPLFFTISLQHIFSHFLCCHMYQYVAICTRMLPYVPVCCHMYLDVAIYTRMLPYVPVCCHMYLYVTICTRMLPHVPGCCHIYPYVAICTRMLPHVPVCCHIYPYVAICTRMLPYLPLYSAMLPYSFISRINSCRHIIQVGLDNLFLLWELHRVLQWWHSSEVTAVEWLGK